MNQLIWLIFFYHITNYDRVTFLCQSQIAGDGDSELFQSKLSISQCLMV